MENEIWKDIAGYEGYYQVSNYGRVKRLPTIVRATHGSQQSRPPVILKNKRSRQYNAVALCKEGTQKYYRVGRLVASAFIPNPNNLPQINHKDCNPKNDCVDNLEWCTAKYNCNYADHNKKLSEAAKRRFQRPEEYAKHLIAVHRMVNDPIWKAHQREAQLNNSNSKPIIMMSLSGEIIRTFPSIAQAYRDMGIPSQNIGQCCKGKIKTAGGYKWRYSHE